MAEADGLLARIRVPGGRLSLAQWAGLGRVAAAHGSGVLELTSRANVQVRGIDPVAVGAVVDELVELGVAHPDPARDGRRNVVATPAAGLDPTEVADVRPVLDELVQCLVADGDGMHPKAGVLVDGGGAISVRGRRADVAFGAARVRRTGEVVFEVRVGGALPLVDEPSSAVAVVRADEVPAVAVAALTSTSGERSTTDALNGLDRIEAADLDRAMPEASAPLGVHEQTGGGYLVGAAPMLGRLDPALVDAIAVAAVRHGAVDIRVTPWRGLLVGGVADAGLLADLGRLGLVTDGADPAARVVACAGRTGCASGTVDTIGDGFSVIAALRCGDTAPRVHLSGCEKRCASHAAHDVTLVGRDDGTYDVFDADEVVVGHVRRAVDAVAGPGGRQ
jgi:precorrin-3B synthase